MSAQAADGRQPAKGNGLPAGGDGRAEVERRRQLLALTRSGGEAAPDPRATLLALRCTLEGLVAPGGTVELEVGEAVEPVALSRPELEWVVLSLARNARTITPSAATLRVVLADVGRGEDRAHPPVTGYVRVSVGNGAPGAPPAALGRAWDCYVTPNGQRPAGVGLAAIRALVTRRGGHLQVISDPRLGHLIHAYLPTARGGAPPTAGVGPAHPPMWRETGGDPAPYRRPGAGPPR